MALVNVGRGTVRVQREGPVQLAQFALQDLPDGAPRQLLDQVHRGQPLRLAYLLVEPSQEVRTADAMADRRHDEGDRRFTPLLGGYTDDGHVDDRRMATHDRLEVARIDVEAAADDHVLLAVEQGQEALRVEA